MGKARNIEVLYGKKTLSAEVPEENLRQVIALPEMKAADELAVIREALENPIGSAPLKELSKDARKIVIIADDITRPMPSGLVIKEMIASLSEPEKKDIAILVATGLHRPMTREEITGRFGELAGKYRIINHNAGDMSSLADFGELSGGNRLFLNRLAKECDLLIAEGFIEPHFFAGFSGGRKSILPGIAGEQTIMNNHSPRNILDPASCMGSMEDNPINRECEEACGKSGLSFILNVSLNSSKQVIAAFAGHPIHAHKAGCEFVKKLVCIKAEPSDIVITSNNGYPLDMNLYQTVKGIVTAARAVKKGGVIIIASECSEGAGHGYFYDSIISCNTAEELYLKSNEGSPANDKWQVQEYVKVLKDHTVILVSGGIKKETAKRLFLLHADNMRQALKMAFNIKGKNASVNVIPEGPAVLPVPE